MTSGANGTGTRPCSPTGRSSWCGASTCWPTIIVVSAAIQRADWRETLEMAALLAGSMLFVTALGLPALYRFGAEKGRYVMILVMGVGIGASLGVMRIFGETPELPDLPLPAVLLLLAVLAAGATYVSFRMSVRFYRKRQNGAYT